MSNATSNWFTRGTETLYRWLASDAKEQSDAWRVFDDFVRSRLTSFARRALHKRPADVNDAVQSTLRRIIEEKDQVPIGEVDDVRRWLYRSAGTVCRALLRHRLARAKTLENVDVAVPGAGTPTQVCRREAGNIVRAELMKLPREDRVVMRLHYLRQRSVETIVRMLGGNAQHIYYVIRRARAVVRARLVEAGVAT